jgi:alpha-glucosidase (family GH31 glycosyl hydrolase)
MNEPSIFRQQTMPGVLRHDCEGQGAAHREIHNAYGLTEAPGFAALRERRKRARKEK